MVMWPSVLCIADHGHEEGATQRTLSEAPESAYARSTPSRAQLGAYSDCGPCVERFSGFQTARSRSYAKCKRFMSSVSFIWIQKMRMRTDSPFPPVSVLAKKPGGTGRSSGILCKNYSMEVDVCRNTGKGKRRLTVLHGSGTGALSSLASTRRNAQSFQATFDEGQESPVPKGL